MPTQLLDTQSNPQALEFLRKGVESLVTTSIHQDVDREKVLQYANARRNDLYYAGKQYIYPVYVGGNIVDYTSTGNLIANAGPKGQSQGRTYDYVLNYYRGLGDKAVAVLSQKPPTVKGMPDRPDDDAAVRRARTADLFASIMRSHWRIEEIVRTIALSLWKNGTTFLYTPWVSNAARYGTTIEPKLDLELQFDLMTGQQVMLPVVKGQTEYENGSVECSVRTIFEVTTPFYIKSLAESPWLLDEHEMHKGTLMAAFPELREMLRSSEGTSDTSITAMSGRLARDMASSPSKTHRVASYNRWLFSRYWLRPAMYELLADGMSGERDQQVAQLRKHFPEGTKVTMVQGKLVRMEHERLDEVWTAIKPRASEYLYADPLGDDFIGAQDVINDMFNIMVESAERGIPITMIDPLIIDPDAMRRQRATPGEFLSVRPGYGRNMKDSMYTPTAAKMEPVIAQVGAMALDAGQQNVGVVPALFGGDDGTEKTAREAILKRDQALMQFSTTWNYLRAGIAQAKENGAIQAARFSNGVIWTRRSASMPPERVDIPEIADLANGGWHYESGENIPMTHGERRDRVQEFLTQAPPEVWQVIGITEPDNLVALQEMFGMADWKVPNLDALYKVRDTIRILSQQEPVVSQMIDPMTGMVVPGEPQPSIPADEFEDNHDFVIAAVRNWAQTQKALELREQFPAGYDNVILWAKQHANIAAMQMMAMQPPPDQQQDGDGPSPGPQQPNGPKPLLPPGPAGAPPPGQEVLNGQQTPPLVM